MNLCIAGDDNDQYCDQLARKLDAEVKIVSVVRRPERREQPRGDQEPSIVRAERYDDQRGWNSGFAETTELIATKTLDLVAGQPSALKMQVQYGRYRLEVGTPGQPGSLVYRFYSGWSAERDQSEGVRPDRVSLKLDKPVYADGDTAHLVINAPHRGEAIVAVEGDKL